MYEEYTMKALFIYLFIYHWVEKFPVITQNLGLYSSIFRIDFEIESFTSRNFYAGQNKKKGYPLLFPNIYVFIAFCNVNLQEASQTTTTTTLFIIY